MGLGWSDDSKSGRLCDYITDNEPTRWVVQGVKFVKFLIRVVQEEVGKKKRQRTMVINKFSLHTYEHMYAHTDKQTRKRRRKASVGKQSKKVKRIIFGKTEMLIG